MAFGHRTTAWCVRTASNDTAARLPPNTRARRPELDPDDIPSILEIDAEWLAFAQDRTVLDCVERVIGEVPGLAGDAGLPVGCSGRGPDDHGRPRGMSSSHLREMTTESPSRAVTSRARWKASASEVMTLAESIRTDQSPRLNS